MRRDPTAEHAIGSVNREWKQMKELAIRIRDSRDPVWADRESRRFTGIYARLLTDPEVMLKRN